MAARLQRCGYPRDMEPVVPSASVLGTRKGVGMQRRRLALAALGGAVATALVVALPAAFASGQNHAAARKKAHPPRVQTGVIGGGCVATKAGDQCSAVASFSPKSRWVLDEAAFGILGGLVEHPECPGAPAGTPGVVCIYNAEEELVNISKNGEGAWSAEAKPILNGRRGFKVTWTAAAAGYTAWYGIWTYIDP